MKYNLPKLPYAYDALEPSIDAQTMEIHHTKHHQAYIDKLNAALEKNPDIADTPIEDLLKTLDSLKIDDVDKTAIRNHGGGYLNHKLFWEIMGPDKEQDKQLLEDIARDFRSVEMFKEQFEEAASTLFGSGWAWLARDPEGKLHIHKMPNQDSPYLHGDTPVIGLDVWEHAYYLKYQNRRADYINNWWNVLKRI